MFSFLCSFCFTFHSFKNISQHSIKFFSFILFAFNIPLSPSPVVHGFPTILHETSTLSYFFSFYYSVPCNIQFCPSINFKISLMFFFLFGQSVSNTFSKLLYFPVVFQSSLQFLLHLIQSASVTPSISYFSLFTFIIQCTDFMFQSLLSVSQSFVFSHLFQFASITASASSFSLSLIM